MSEQHTTITLEGGDKEFNKNALYLVDFSSFKSVEDLVLVFAAMGLSFSGHHPKFEQIKHLLDLENPVQTNVPTPPQPSEDNLRLPKLKSL
jgi:hypothetical protein